MGDSNKGGYGNKTVGRDLYHPVGQPGVIGRAQLAPAHPVPLSPNAQAQLQAPRAMKPMYLENLPPVMDKLGFPMGASFMRFWQANKGFVLDSAPKHAHRTRVLDHDHLKTWTHVKKYPLEKLRSLRPWLDGSQGDNARKEALIKRIRDKFNNSSHPPDSMLFPEAIVNNPPALTQTGPKGLKFSFPFSNDAAWADAVDHYEFFFEPGGGDGAGIMEFLSTDPFDDYGFAVGTFGWHFVPSGVAMLIPATGNKPESLEVTINKVGIFALDSYDFNGLQPLGFWDVDAEKVTAVSGSAVAQITPGLGFFVSPSSVPADGRYKSGLGFTRIGNSDFRKYRDIVGNGRDFMSYSDVKFFDVTVGSFTFPRVP